MTRTDQYILLSSYELHPGQLGKASTDSLWTHGFVSNWGVTSQVPLALVGCCLRDRVFVPQLQLLQDPQIAQGKLSSEHILATTFAEESDTRRNPMKVAGFILSFVVTLNVNCKFSALF